MAVISKQNRYGEDTGDILGVAVSLEQLYSIKDRIGYISSNHYAWKTAHKLMSAIEKEIEKQIQLQKRSIEI